MFKSKILRSISAMLAVASFFLLMGTIGAIDSGNVSIVQALFQEVISISLLAGFAKLAGAFN